MELMLSLYIVRTCCMSSCTPSDATMQENCDDMLVPMLVHTYRCLLTTDDCLKETIPNDARLQLCSL